jgi:hypothetical protein
MWVRQNNPGQILLKVLVTVFFFPIGLLILLWKGERVVWLPLDNNGFPVIPVNPVEPPVMQADIDGKYW